MWSRVEENALSRSRLRSEPRASATGLLRRRRTSESEYLAGLFFLLRALVPNRKASIGPRRQLNPEPVATRTLVGDELDRRVVHLGVALGVVQLPDIRRSRRFVNRFPRLLARAVIPCIVHDRRFEMQRLHDR